MDVEPKPDANHNEHWQGAMRALNEDDEDDAVNSPQDNCPRTSGQAPGNHSLSRMQQQGLPAHQQPGHARAGLPPGDCAAGEEGAGMVTDPLTADPIPQKTSERRQQVNRTRSRPPW